MSVTTRGKKARPGKKSSKVRAVREYEVNGFADADLVTVFCPFCHRRITDKPSQFPAFMRQQAASGRVRGKLALLCNRCGGKGKAVLVPSDELKMVWAKLDLRRKEKAEAKSAKLRKQIAEQGAINGMPTGASWWLRTRMWARKTALVTKISDLLNRKSKGR